MFNSISGTVVKQNLWWKSYGISEGNVPQEMEVVSIGAGNCGMYILEGRSTSGEVFKAEIRPHTVVVDRAHSILHIYNVDREEVGKSVDNAIMSLYIPKVDMDLFMTEFHWMTTPSWTRVVIEYHSALKYPQLESIKRQEERANG